MSSLSLQIWRHSEHWADHRDPTWVVATCDFLSRLLKNILHQHLLLGAGESDTSVARQPLWLLFCRAGPLTRFLFFFFSPSFFPVKVASLCFDAFAVLENVRESKRNMFIIDVPVFAPALDHSAANAGAGRYYFLCCVIMFFGKGEGGRKQAATANVGYYLIKTEILHQRVFQKGVHRGSQHSLQRCFRYHNPVMY